jgi:signal transduction histidine kinase/ActR/RegA family two-component response regulator
VQLGPLKRLDSATTLAQRLSLLTVLFLAPLAILLSTLTVYALRDITFTEREVRGAALLKRAWPGVAGQPAPGAEGLTGPARRLGVEGELRAFSYAQPDNRAEAGAVWIGAIADASNLTLDRHLTRFYLGEAATIGIPDLWAAIRRIEQVSALPPDIPGRRERTLATYERMNAQAEVVDQALVKASNNQADPDARHLLEDHRAELNAARVVALAQRQAMAAGGNADLTALRRATTAAWETTTAQLYALVKSELDLLLIRFGISLLITAISVGAALALAVAIHRGITGRLDGLIRAMSRLIDGDLNVEVPHLDQRNELGRIAEAVLAFRESQRQRAQLEEDAVAAERAKSVFLANVSHEIRTPLNGVIGVGSALAATPLSPEQRRMVDLIRASGRDVERLMSDILDVASLDAGDLKLELAIFDLVETIQAAIAPQRARAAEKGLALRLDFNAQTEGRFEGDPARLAQVVANLTANAVKFTESGEVVISIATLPTEVPSTRRLTVEVRDTGVGFDEALLPRLLQPFTQADGSLSRRHGGSGLGLPICKAIVELLGGTLEARSRRGAGSCFRFTVPLRLASQVAPIPANEPVERPARVLLVEDHEVNRAVVELLLAPLGVELVMACDGQEGIEAFEGDHFDLVLMDMQMPRVDGLAATRRLRDIEARRGEGRTPIVMLTANVGPEHQLAALAAGADAHLAKPIDRERLWNVIMSGPMAA